MISWIAYYMAEGYLVFHKFIIRIYLLLVSNLHKVNPITAILSRGVPRIICTKFPMRHDLKECLQGALETLALRSKVRVNKADFFGVAQQRCGTSCHLCGCALNTALSLGMPARLFQFI
jgi:hypothetical protein